MALMACRKHPNAECFNFRVLFRLLSQAEFVTLSNRLPKAGARPMNALKYGIQNDYVITDIFVNRK